MFTETHKKNWAKQHSQLLRWTPNGQFESKMKLSLEGVSKITPTSLTIRIKLTLTHRQERQYIYAVWG